jgi:hypothetical protein
MDAAVTMALDQGSCIYFFERVKEGRAYSEEGIWT